MGNPEPQSQANDQTQKASTPRSLLMAATRLLMRLLFCTCAVAVHDWWFSIGSRGIPMAMLDGLVLGGMCLGAIEVWKFTEAPSVGRGNENQ